MNHKATSVYIFLLIVFLLFAASFSLPTVRAQVGQRLAPASSTDAAFTYQGRLDEVGLPANGQYDMQFALYDAPILGNQVGVTVTQVVEATDGLFTTLLDFGRDAFSGEARYLAIAVRPADVGNFEPLTPRQPIAAVPYATYAEKVKPIDNRVVVAKSGGDFTSISDALAAITDATQGNPYLIKVAPGVYTETVTMKSFVNIAGSGELVTTIVSHFSEEFSSSPTGGTVVGADNAELSHLTVKNATTGNGEESPMAIAIFNSGVAPRLSHVTAQASGHGDVVYSYAIYNDGTAPVLEHVTALADSSPFAVALYNRESSLVANHLNARAEPGNDQQWGLGIENLNSFAKITNSTIYGANIGAFSSYFGDNPPDENHTVHILSSHIDALGPAIEADDAPVYATASVLDGAIDVVCANSSNTDGEMLNADCIVEPEDGKALAAVYARCNNTDSVIERSYDRTASVGPFIYNGSVAGRCRIQFVNLDLNQRFWSVTARHSSLSVRGVTCTVDSSNSSILECQRWDAAGAGAGGHIMVIVH